MAHEREIKEEQLFLDLALTALDHMRDEARSLARQCGRGEHARRR